MTEKVKVPAWFNEMTQYLALKTESDRLEFIGEIATATSIGKHQMTPELLHTLIQAILDNEWDVETSEVVEENE